MNRGTKMGFPGIGFGSLWMMVEEWEVGHHFVVTVNPI